MSDNLEKLYEAALKAAATQGDSQVEKIGRLAHAWASVEDRNSDEWGTKRSHLHLAIEDGIRSWVKAHPDHFKIEEPDQPVYNYEDVLLHSLDAIGKKAVGEIFSFSRHTFNKISKKAIAALKAKSSDGERSRVAKMFPRYPEVLREIRVAKKQWNTADQAIKKTYAFRMMGGLARMGTQEYRRYSNLVEEAQKMEKQAIGVVLTKKTGAR